MIGSGYALNAPRIRCILHLVHGPWNCKIVEQDFDGNRELAAVMILQCFAICY